MPLNSLSYKSTGYFSQLICNYLAEADTLKPFYNRFPKLENFKSQIEEKQAAYKGETRAVFVSTLEKQYKVVETSKATLLNIKSLKNKNTFTVTTGHQLNLFTGPLYFLHKIVSTINLTKQLKKEYPNYDFVPIYWMASEDHDFDEINYFNFRGKKIQWNRKASGVVGELDTVGLSAVLEIFSKELGIGKNAETLKTLFRKAYLEHNTLTEATFYLANKLFKKYGLVILEPNKNALKSIFIPHLEKELIEQISFKKITETNKALDTLSQDYTIQVNPREINLFYIKEDIRERIVFQDNKFKVLNTIISWSKNELLKELKTSPERFSPNVVLRPLYQEVILPNLCYIGGGGELAYWFQLKSNFEANNVVFPMLLLRNSALIQTNQQVSKLKKLNISTQDIFLKREMFINKKVREISNVNIDFSKQIIHLKKQFEDLYTLAKKTDESFTGAVTAQEKKQINGLEHLEKRLLTAQKRKLKDQVERMTQLQDELFPNQSLQERNINFSELYLEFGDNLIPNLINELQPLKGEFTVLTF